MRSLNVIHLVNVSFLFWYVLPKKFADASLIDTAAYIANLNYKPHYVTSLVWWQSYPEYIAEFSIRFHGSLVITPIQNNNKSRIRDLNKAAGYKQTVMLADSAEEFTYFITLVNFDLVVPIRVLLVLTKPVHDLSEITRIAWNNDLVDILILKQNEAGDVKIYTYFPYNNGICGDFTPVQLEVDTKDFFPKKFANFYGCPIRTTLLEVLPYVKLERKNNNITSIAGIDGNVLMFIIGRVNASIDIVSSNVHGEMGSYINGTGTGTFGDLVNRKADIFAPAAIINSKRYLVAQVSHVYSTLDVYWIAPNRREIYAWVKVFLPIFSNIMPLTSLVFTVFVIVIILYKRISFHNTVTKDSVCFQAFIIFLGQYAKFETRSTVINAMFMLWIWFCLIVRIDYQGDLVDGFHKRILESRMKSLNDAIKAVDAYGGSEIFREFYKGTSVAKNYKLLPLMEIPLYIKEITDGKRFLLAVDLLMVRYSRGNVQVLDEPVMRAATCLYMRPGWPASKEIDNLINRVIESGFVKKIRYDNKLEWLSQENADNSEEANPLNMSTLSACFYGLIVLWIISFIVLILEIIIYTIKEKRRNLTGV